MRLNEKGRQCLEEDVEVLVDHVVGGEGVAGAVEEVVVVVVAVVRVEADSYNHQISMMIYL